MTEQTIMDVAALVASLNKGSLRRAGDKAGTTLVNRFGPVLAEFIGDDPDEGRVTALATALAVALQPGIRAALYEACGWEVPDAEVL